MSGRGLLVLASLGVLAACLALVAAIVVTKLGRGRVRRRRDARLGPLRADLIAVAAGEDGDERAAVGLCAADSSVRDDLVGAVVELLGKVRGQPAERLVEVLRGLGALDRARRELGHRSPVRRARAAQLLGRAREPSAVPGLVSALDDHAPEVRASAAYALGLIGDPAAARPLLGAVAGQAGGLPAGIAADALLAMGIGVSDALLDALQDPEPRTRTVAAHVSGIGSFTRSLHALRTLLAADPDLTVRETCAAAIGAIGRTDDVGELARHTESHHPAALRRVCAVALGHLGDPTAIPALTGLLHDDDPRLAELSATALLGLRSAGRDVLEAERGSRPVEVALTLARLQGALR